jgi:hypothetical protein
MKCKIIPKTQRAKNRVREHGKIMFFLKREHAQCLNNQIGTLVESLDKSWKGWFSDDEADIKEV